MRQIPYEYKNLPISGGGYVTGFLYSEKEKDVLYIRTDIGGTYRFDAKEKRWVSLISHVTMDDLSETFPISIAIDEERPGSLFIACGVNRAGSGVLAISEDYGEHFTYEKIPVLIHGNLNGRGTGERLLVRGKTLYFASQQEGLWKSTDGGKSWEKLTAFPEEYLTFVGEVKGALLVGTAGVTTRKAENMRGHSLYVSYDDGVSFVPLEEPESHVIEGCRYNGLVAQRWCWDEKYLYVTFASTGRRSYVWENGYSCDSGDTIDGHIVRYSLGAAKAAGTAGDMASAGNREAVRDMASMENREVAEVAGDIESMGAIEAARPFGPMEDITPGFSSAVSGIGWEKARAGELLDYGFSGISASRQTPGMLAATTMVKDDGDSVLLSMDYGKTWRQILYDLAEGEMTFRAPYMRPEYNGGHSLIHWLSDIKINPFDDREAWFNTGTGVFHTHSLKEETCKFTDWCDGIEETVHLNVYGMPGGKVQVIDILGDLGGFAFEEPDKPCENSFADAQGNRYITCINADFSDAHPEWLVVTPRGNWTGKTLGGLILSKDQGKTFERLPMPFGLTEDLDEALRGIERPNVNSGWVAMAPNGRNIVWSVAEGIDLPIRRVIGSRDGGRTFVCCKVYDRMGERKTEGKMKVFSDRVDSNLFYGFGGRSEFYISRDGGETFREYELPEEFPEIDFGKIDCANKTEVRGETGKSGVFYMAVGEAGLWKLCYDSRSDGTELAADGGSTGEGGSTTDSGSAGEAKRTGVLKLVRLTAPDITVYRMGLGIGSPKGDYFKDGKAVYFNGIVEGKYGFYRTLDDGATFERLNTDRQMFGEINSIDGDCRVFGRFYLATGSNGIKYGMYSENQEK